MKVDVTQSMNTSAVSATSTDLLKQPGAISAAIDSREKNNKAPISHENTTRDYTRGDVEKALDKVQKSIEVFDRRLHFKVHEKTKHLQVQVIDSATGEVVGEIPPKKVLDLLASIQEITGLLFDKKA